jgi:hypothetical protein
VQKFVPRNHVGIFRSKRTQSTPWTLNWYIGAFHTIWVHLGPFGCLTKLGAKQDELLQVTSEFYATNAPDPSQWTLNWCSGAFHIIWVHWGPFGCVTKLGAKRAELVQKLVPRSHIKIFHSKRTQSTPLNPKLKFWCVSYYLGAFGTVWLPYETWCKIGRTSAKVSATMLRRNFFPTNAPNKPHWTLNWCFGAFRTISVHLGPFGCLTKLDAKRAELVQKFMPRSRVGIFRSNRTQSTLLNPKLIYWCVSYYLGAFGTVW